jgi:hypothetical protein
MDKRSDKESEIRSETMSIRTTPTQEPEARYTQVEPIFDASGTLRHVSTSSTERKASAHQSDRRPTHPAR